MNDLPTGDNQSDEVQQVQFRIRQGETEQQGRARLSLDPALFNSVSVVNFSRPAKLGGRVDETMQAMSEVAARVKAGDMQDAESMLVCQALALNSMFGELTRRATVNMTGGGKFMEATKAYMAMALKCQNQARMTLETLATVKNPPVFARQANINSGNGQMQVNNASSPARASENSRQPSKILEQPHEEIRMDPGTEGAASRGDPSLAAMDPRNGAKDS